MSILSLLIISVLVYLFLFSQHNNNRLIISDVSRTKTVNISAVVPAVSRQNIYKIIENARINNKKICIAGSRHSQNGQINTKDAIIINIKKYNKIISFDPIKKTIRCETGITWNQIQKYIAPYNLAIKVMQTYSGFTLGGSLSVNCHGRDPNFGSMIETILSFDIILSDGNIITVTPEHELFNLVIGGYGLFGFVLDVTIQLVDDCVYRRCIKYMDTTSYIDHFKNTIQSGNVGMHFAWPLLNKNSEDKIFVITYYKTDLDINKKYPEQQSTYLSRFLFRLARSSDLVKHLNNRIKINSIKNVANSLVSRSLALDPDVTMSLPYMNDNYTDLLQSYFVPLHNFDEFMSYLKFILSLYNVNILFSTIRFIPKGNKPVLRYIHSEYDQMAVVINFNQQISFEDNWTGLIVDKVLSLDGNFYLPSHIKFTSKQLRKAYPNIDYFIEKKNEYDKDNIFISDFYLRLTQRDDLQ